MRHIRFVWLVTILLFIAGNPAGAQAQAYPERPVRLVVGFSPGSGTDVVARLIAQRLSDAWERPVVVENLAGAGGNIAAGRIAKSAPDGYSLLFANNGLAISASLHRDLPYNVRQDLTAVTQVTSAPHLLVVNPALQVTSLNELVALAKSHPGKINFASAGVGNSDHMAAELLKHMADVNMVHVPYKGGPPAMNAVISGEVGLYFPSLTVGLPMVRAGKVKALGVSGTRRARAAPDVPTIAESGLPGYEVVLWYGLYAPAGTPLALVNKVADGVRRTLVLSDVRSRLTALGFETVESSPAEFADFTSREIEKWAAIVKAARLAVD